MSEYNPFALKDKTILVTGASSGIGRATAVECSRLGAKVFVTGRNAERLQATFDRLEGDGHHQVLSDLASDDGLASLVEACPELNGVVLCAGVNRPMPFSMCSKGQFAEILNLDFAAPVELLRLLLKGRKISDAASAVLVSSIAGSRGGTAAGNAMYGASKAALDGAMRHLAREFGGRRIRFNSVCPGMVDTPFIANFKQSSSAERIAADKAEYPLGRYGEPDDIAHGIAYLLSDAASWVTGTRLVIDGGLTA